MFMPRFIKPLWITLVPMSRFVGPVPVGASNGAPPGVVKVATGAEASLLAHAM